MKGACREDGERQSARGWSYREKGNGFELKESRFRLNVREKLFTVRVGRPWHRVPREVLAAPSLAVSKDRMGGAWSSLGQWKVSLPMGGSLE